MKNIAFDKIKLTPDEMGKITPLLNAEARHAWEMYKSGKYRELYFRTDHPGAVMVLECENVEEAKKLTDDLPLVKAGYIEFEFIPVGPFTPFEELFEK